MKKISTLFFAGISLFSVAQSGVDWGLRGATQIDSADLRKHLSVLASDEYEGRETGKKGQQMSAAYIENVFRSLGCATVPGMNGYQQYFDVIETTPGGSVNIGKGNLLFRTDFIYFGTKRLFQLKDQPILTAEAAKFNTEKKDYVLIHKLEGLGVRETVGELKKNAPEGLKAIVLVVSDYATIYEYLEHYTTNKSMRLADQPGGVEIPTIVVRADALKPLLPKQASFLFSAKKAKKLRKMVSFGRLNAQLNENEQRLTSSNVLAYIEGSDPVLKNEVVFITAHYDHIGVQNGVVYNGADDDGTGTVSILELAQAFMEVKNAGHGPKRSIILMTVSGEEKGLLGSSYYTDHPVIPLSKTIADLNIDMIGRYDIAHEEMEKESKLQPAIDNNSPDHRTLEPIKNVDYIYVIGSNMLSDDLHNANENANSRYTHLNLDYKFNSLTDPNQFYYRSDHYNFAKNGIPSIFYFSGVHVDYHQPTDDIEKINFSKVQRVAQLVFFTAWDLVNAPNRPVVNH